MMLGVFHANIYVSWSTSELRVRLAPWNRFRPSSKIFLLTGSRRYSFCGSFMLFLSCVCYAFVRVCLLLPCGHLPFVVSNCEFVTFPLVSWVRCGTWLYWFLIFALFLTFMQQTPGLTHTFNNAVNNSTRIVSPLLCKCSPVCWAQTVNLDKSNQVLAYLFRLYLRSIKCLYKLCFAIYVHAIVGHVNISHV